MEGKKRARMSEKTREMEREECGKERRSEREENNIVEGR